LSGVKNRLIAFNYFGGKFNHSDWVVKRLPETKSYVEVFAGSAIVLLNRKPSRIETYNDINSRVVNFFKVLREQSGDLISNIFLSPYAREEYLDCYKNLDEGNDLEKARKLFVVLNQSFNGTYSRQTGWKMSTKETRATTSEAVSRWMSKLPNLVKIVDRLKYVQITNYDFRTIFEKFDSRDTLFYCDPPYLHDTRCNNNEYEYEMNSQDHIDLLNLCRSAKGKIALSGYENEIYNKHLKGFFKSVAKEKRDTLMHSKRREILWTNYDPDQINVNLFTENN
jgi:DNA adenine methylase